MYARGKYYFPYTQRNKDLTKFVESALEQRTEYNPDPN